MNNQGEHLLCDKDLLKLENLGDVRGQSVPNTAAELQDLAEREVERLKDAGWTQADFARALRICCEEE